MIEDPFATEHLPADQRERLLVERRRLYRMRAMGVLATAVQAAGGAAAAILVANILLVVGDANPDNAIARFVAGFASVLAPGFHDLFTPADANLRVIVNYGLAAACWLFVTGVVTRTLRRAASPYQIS